MTTVYIFWIIAGALTAFAVLMLIRPIGKSRTAIALTIAVPVAALALYVTLGRPDLTQWHTKRQLPPFIAASVTKLTQDVAANPTDIQAWVLLGDVYAKIDRYGAASDAYRRAAALAPSTPLYKAMVGQMLVMQNGGAVGSDALAWFDQAQTEPIARYYFALAKSQAGDWKGALDEWQALAKDTPNGAQGALADRITDARQALGLDRH